VHARHSGVAEPRLVPELVRDLIGRMVNDVLGETRRRIEASGVQSVEAVRATGRPLAGFSDAMAAEERALKSFLHARMYDAPSVQAVRAEAQRMLAALFETYRADPERLPPEWRPADEAGAIRAIGDFIAGMTDRYAIRQYRDLIGPVDLPEGF